MSTDEILWLLRELEQEVRPVFSNDPEDEYTECDRALEKVADALDRVIVRLAGRPS